MSLRKITQEEINTLRTVMMCEEAGEDNANDVEREMIRYKYNTMTDDRIIKEAYSIYTAEEIDSFLYEKE